MTSEFRRKDVEQIARGAYELPGHGTPFKADDPDSLEVGLEDYRVNEIRTIVDFAQQRSAQVMLLAGLSCAGKTTLLKKAQPEIGAAYVDLQDTRKRDDLAVWIDEIHEQAQKSLPGSRDVLILNEGPVFLKHAERNRFDRSMYQFFFHQLLDSYKKVIFCSTSEKELGGAQNSRVLEVLPRGIAFEELMVRLKMLNERQIIELLSPMNPLISPEMIERVAHALIDFFRIPWAAWMTGRNMNFNDSGDLALEIRAFWPSYMKRWIGENLSKQQMAFKACGINNGTDRDEF